MTMIAPKHFDNEMLEMEDENGMPSDGKNEHAVVNKQKSIPILFTAIHAGNIDGVRNVLDQTMEFLNSSFYCGLTPMHSACHVKQLEILKLLISRGAKVGSFDNLGNSVLHVAVKEKWHDGVTELLLQGASPNTISQPPSSVSGILKETPLHVAVRMEDNTSVTQLLMHQADLGIRDSKNRSIFHLAVSTKNHLILKQLLSEQDSLKHLKDMEKDSNSLFHAALSGKATTQNESQILKVIQTLHRYCQDVNQVNLLGETPLILACRAGLPNIVKFLLTNGADPTQVTHERQSTVHAACISGCSATLRHLLSTNSVGFLITCTDNDGYHPFYYAIESASVDCCKILLNNGEHLTHIGKGDISNCKLVLEKLLSAMQLFRSLFDSSVKLEHDKNDSITFDYSVLMTSESKKMQCSIASELANTHLESLIKHPLIESFLYLKWCRIRTMFYFNVILYLLYILLHTVFVMLTFGYDPIDWSKYPERLMAFKLLHIFFIIVCFVPGAVIIFANYQKYLLQCETYTRTITVLSSAIVIFMYSSEPAEDVSSASEPVPCDVTSKATSVDDSPADVRPTLSTDRAMASISVFFIWLELMMLLGRFPVLGAYIMMFNKVAKLVIKFILSFLSLLIGFSLMFHILFQELNVFADYQLSFAKTLMMMIGDISYSEFVEKKEIPFSTFSLVVMSTFLFMVTVIMSNLLIGLAVMDLPDLKRQGKINRLVKQASYLMAYEKVFSWKYFPGKLRSMASSRYNIKSFKTISPIMELKRYSYNQTIPRETLKEAIRLVSCEYPEDFLTETEKDISGQLKAFQIKYSSDRRTQMNKFTNLNDVCTDIKKQMDQLQYKFDSQLSHITMQLQQQLKKKEKKRKRKKK